MASDQIARPKSQNQGSLKDHSESDLTHSRTPINPAENDEVRIRSLDDYLMIVNDSVLHQRRKILEESGILRGIEAKLDESPSEGIPLSTLREHVIYQMSQAGIHLDEESVQKAINLHYPSKKDVATAMEELQKECPRIVGYYSPDQFGVTRDVFIDRGYSALVDFEKAILHSLRTSYPSLDFESDIYSSDRTHMFLGFLNSWNQYRNKHYKSMEEFGCDGRDIRDVTIDIGIADKDKKKSKSRLINWLRRDKKKKKTILSFNLFNIGSPITSSFLDDRAVVACKDTILDFQRKSWGNYKIPIRFNVCYGVK